MSDQTVYAEALIATLARAFYDDDVVCLIDVLLRDKFLRDDDMGPRLHMPAKQLRRTMQYLQDELLVKYELVDDLIAGGSQATRFWYIDYNHAVNVIRLRIYLLKKKLEEAEIRARSSSVYLCPGYSNKTCNGKYTETEAQQVVDYETGLFLCQECVNMHESNPEPPSKSSYTLQLVDNTKDLKVATENLRRVTTQLCAKRINNYQLRPGIYDLLQKVRVKGKGPLSSNLPSENRALGIGSNRLAGTGRTAGIKAKKLAQQAGITVTSGNVHRMIGEGATRSEEGAGELNFLKNARGEEIAFEVEKGGGARAKLLANRTRRTGKLFDAAAARVGVSHHSFPSSKKKARLDKNDKKQKDDGNLFNMPPFLIGNICNEDDTFLLQKKRANLEEEESSDDEEEGNFIDDELAKLSPEERRKAFLSLYKIEMARQNRLLLGNLSDEENHTPVTINGNHNATQKTADGNYINWENG